MEESNFAALKSLQITVVGLGLMGGSLALRLKRDARCRKIVALVRTPQRVAEAESRHAVDMATTNPEIALANADIVVFCTPVRVLAQQLEAYAHYFKAGAIITDVGSTKRRIVAVLNDLPAHVYPVGSHPMCGKETSGLTAAETTLYDDATWVISALERSPANAVELVALLAQAVGAKPVRLPPERHDLLVAAISHLPYLLSAGLALTAEQVAQIDPRVWDVAASGFRDTSRLAASDVTMMLDILLTNADMVSELLSQYGEQLIEFSKLLTTDDESRLRDLLTSAHNIRKAVYLPENE